MTELLTAAGVAITGVGVFSVIAALVAEAVR